MSSCASNVIIKTFYDKEVINKRQDKYIPCTATIPVPLPFKRENRLGLYTLFCYYLIKYDIIMAVANTSKTFKETQRNQVSSRHTCTSTTLFLFFQRETVSLA